MLSLIMLTIRGFAMHVAKKGSKTWVKLVTALFILKIIRDAPAYGNKIAAEIKGLTFGLVEPNPNFLYPLLRAMEEEGYVVGDWEKPGTRGKRIYTITEKGGVYLSVLKQQVQARFIEIQRKQEAIRNYLLDDCGDAG
jgi:DNA-binding PadR family transcriptional regulator